LRVVFALQLLCVALFLFSSLFDLLGLQPHWQSPEIRVVVRFLAAIGLVLGTVLGWSALRHSIRRTLSSERKLQAASNAFMELVEAHFSDWGLTPAERDVALFSLKGMTVNEIAELRGTSPGTVKAQTNAIYRKAGVGGRPQLLSLFIDDLIQDELPAHMAATAPAEPGGAAAEPQDAAA
jgi:DNA-binding CsgD family transcriptional regulator